MDPIASEPDKTVGSARDARAGILCTSSWNRLPGVRGAPPWSIWFACESLSPSTCIVSHATLMSHPLPTVVGCHIWHPMNRDPRAVSWRRSGRSVGPVVGGPTQGPTSGCRYVSSGVVVRRLSHCNQERYAEGETVRISLPRWTSRVQIPSPAPVKAVCSTVLPSPQPRSGPSKVPIGVVPIPLLVPHPSRIIRS